MKENDANLNALYERVRQVKQAFYESKNQNDWDKEKENLKIALKEAETLMSKEFYRKYKQGVVDSVSKMYKYKQNLFNQGQKKSFSPKQNYIFRENEGEAFIKLCEALTEFLGRRN